ncbi:MAG: ABC transporter permease subunit [Verrucomicrobia bacterium]|nr:ABC transporter permease subunit [Verrucomicrobiota bacterium]
MTFLPIVERELRVAARKVTTHRMWLISAVCASAIFFVLFVAIGGPSGIRQAGSQIFVAISILVFAFTLVAGVFLTADCLCSERKEGTLGLLFLTDLRGYDIVLGKLVATSMVAFYTVLAVIPILGVPLMMGGVTGAEFGRTVLALLTTLLFSLAIGMFASAVSRDTRAAMLASFGIILGLTGVLYLISLIGAELMHPNNAEWLLLPSPLLSFTRAFDGWYQFRSGESQFWASVIVMLGLAGGLLVFSSLWLPHSWRAESKLKSTGAAPSPRRPGRRSSEPMMPNPFAWLVGRDRFPGAVLAWVFGTLGIAWLVCTFGSLAVSGPDFRKLYSISFLSAFGFHVIVKGLMAVQATRRLCDERRSGALELLLATPLQPVQILTGQRSVFRRQFKPFAWALTLMNVSLLVVMGVNYPRDFGGDDVLMFAAIFSGGSLLLWVDFYAIDWVGMWAALRGPRPHRAVLIVVSRVLLLPWVAVFVFIASIFNRALSDGAFWLCWSLWMLLCITTSCMAAAKSKRQLTRAFREMAAGDVPSKRSGASRPWSPGWEGGATPKPGARVARIDRLPTP